MEPDAIVVAVDERRDVFAKVIEVAVVVGIDLLPLKRFCEALATGVSYGFAGRLMLGIMPRFRSKAA
jgi:hypothetical protein